MKISAIICAAGRGTRAGFGKNKLLTPLYGQPVIYTSVEKFYGIADEIIVAVSPEDLAEMSAILSPFGAVFSEGGSERFESVSNALSSVTGDIVLIHDGARPFIDRNTIKACIEEVKRSGSAVCARPVTDTVALCENDKITAHADRDKLCLLQTPQCFYTADIKRAYSLAANDGNAYTDDSSVYLKYIAPPTLIPGGEENVKLTYKSQFNAQYPAFNRNFGDAVGFGSDVHAFSNECGDITLCGVKIKSDRKLIAHSDGDVPVHALMDALLSAAGLDDIGHYFPDTDEKFSGADSLKLLKKVIKSIMERGFAPANISIAIQTETPRLSAYIESMKRNIAAACNLPAEHVGIGAGTGEGLGFVGSRLGISATAAVLLKKIQD